MTKYKNSIVWLRHDLRLEDHTALKKACIESENVYLLFVFDHDILKPLKKDDKRVSFIWNSLVCMKQKLEETKGKVFLKIVHGKPKKIIPELVELLSAECIYASDDYEPTTLRRDEEVYKAVKKHDANLELIKNTVIFHRDEVLKKDGQPYLVFTPYKRAWLAKLQDKDIRAFNPDKSKISSWPASTSAYDVKEMSDFGFTPNASPFKGGSDEAKKMLKKFLTVIDDYKESRDYPILEKTSLLSIHIRFGTISIRELMRKTRSLKSAGAEAWVSELIWREFYKMILFKFPHVETDSFQPKYDKVGWPGKEEHFEAWKNGMTGYPIIDAAMRHFKDTGLMHNRLRMVVAQFLTKDLHLHWSYGEKYFAEKLLDFDLSANNGGWQWSSSTGCDSQPYFRIFNPYLQSKRFDAKGEFIKKYVPELKDVDAKFLHDPEKLELNRPKDYPRAIVTHKQERLKAIELFKAT